MKHLSIELTQKERNWGFTYLLIQLLLLPSLLSLLNTALPHPLSDANLNILFFCLNFLAVCCIFHRFLHLSLRRAKERLWYCLRYAFLGFLLFEAAGFLFSYAAKLIRPDFFNVNDQHIGQMAQQNFTFLMLATVFLVPITEECLFRGVLFCGFHRKSRLLAYAVSTLFFALIHVMGYMGQVDLGVLILCYIQYLPAGLCLAWVYEKSDTIIAPMLMHITINQIGFLAMR